MRHVVAWTASVWTVLAIPVPGFAQFASDRPTPPTNLPAQTPSTPPATLPSSPLPTGMPTTAPATRSAPVATPQPSAPHPWAVKPEYGAWFVSVKSYSGEKAREHAEQLAQHIRQTHNAGAYLFEWGAEERQKEAVRRAALRQAVEQEQAPFLQIQAQFKAKAEQEGVAFLETPAKFRVGKVEYPEQWAVLVGGFKDMDSARKALDVIRQWPVPQAEHLLDRGIITRHEERKSEGAFFNPYKSAMVVPNPAIKRNAVTGPAADPVLAKLNEEEPLSLLKAKRPWTLMVKRFQAPSRVQGREGNASVMEKLLGLDEAARMLDANAKQARELAQALRHPNMKPQPFETFVLHGRTDSVVTVGQYDSPEDPALAATWKKLYEMTFKIEYEDGRPPEYRKMFDAVVPMQVPR